MPAGERRTKDQEMAQRLKHLGEERTTGRCCMCYSIVHVGFPQVENPMGFYNHILSCPGPRKQRPVYNTRRAA